MYRKILKVEEQNSKLIKDAQTQKQKPLMRLRKFLSSSFSIRGTSKRRGSKAKDALASEHSSVGKKAILKKFIIASKAKKQADFMKREQMATINTRSSLKRQRLKSLFLEEQLKVKINLLEKMASPTRRLHQSAAAPTDFTDAQDTHRSSSGRSPAPKTLPASSERAQEAGREGAGNAPRDVQGKSQLHRKSQFAAYCQLLAAEGNSEGSGSEGGGSPATQVQNSSLHQLQMLESEDALSNVELLQQAYFEDLYSKRVKGSVYVGTLAASAIRLSRLYRFRRQRQRLSLRKYGVFDLFHRAEEELTSPLIDRRFKQMLLQEAEIEERCENQFSEPKVCSSLEEPNSATQQHVRRASRSMT